jgi:hypothetical protein
MSNMLLPVISTNTDVTTVWPSHKIARKEGEYLEMFWEVKHCLQCVNKYRN